PTRVSIMCRIASWSSQTRIRMVARILRGGPAASPEKFGDPFHARDERRQPQRSGGGQLRASRVRCQRIAERGEALGVGAGLVEQEEPEGSFRSGQGPDRLVVPGKVRQRLRSG